MTDRVKENKTMEENIESEGIKENQQVDSSTSFEEVLEELVETQEEEGNTENDELTELKQKLEQTQTRMLRIQADFDNYRKRVQKEKDEMAKYASAKIIELLLDPIDNFERAIQSSTDSGDFNSLAEGVRIVYRQIEEVLQKEGLEPIDALGKVFNPEYHQAVMQVELEEHDSGVVVEELQKGYKFKDKVIRPSMVKVNA